MAIANASTDDRTGRAGGGTSVLMSIAERLRAGHAARRPTVHILAHPRSREKVRHRTGATSAGAAAPSRSDVEVKLP
jgi:hypothetical protein